ncbi:Helicase, superfamily 3, DNA virus,P-loop containing nucleoside triphosphate hydrolase,Parvovirus [Cinara cedri]|uniref:Helicase, superfamily 3, DNA virus,P-loop containing nucleoside triphosphate hydrolase,Parvovirus n=1 Tax=Cinara cedri TaxID=506608 RepID=A0A5E4NN98_9HEMI|nr:Helicase, superfamily 3, DNA virus,P-loop containing nucleoside triphosphate hydrolase,Parvovirus [Cinara cedri]
MRRIDYGRDTSEHTLGAKEKKLIGERIRRLTAQKIQSRQAERRGPGTTDRQNIENDFERIDIVLPGQYEFGNIGEQRGLYSDNTGYESDFGYDEDVSIMDFGSDDERSKSPIFNNENPESVVDEEDYGVNSCGKTTRSIGSRSVISTSYSAYDCPEEEFNDKLGELAVIVASKHVSGKHRYIHRIAVFNGPEGVLGCVSELRENISRFPPKHWYIIASHGEHLHVVHVCQYTNGSCRCRWLDESGRYQRNLVDGKRRSLRAAGLDARDWRAVLCYLSNDERVVEEVGGFTEDERLCTRFKHLSKTRPREFSQVGILDRSFETNPCNVCLNKPDFKDGESSVEGDVLGSKDSGAEVGRHKRWKRGKQMVSEEYGPISIEQLLYQYPTCPPQAYKKIKEFVNNPNVNKTLENCKYAQVDVRNWCSRLNMWTLKEFESYYNDITVKPYWNGYNRLKSEVYYDIPDSVEIAEKLLIHQFVNEDKVVDFLKHLLYIVDKRIPKLNTLAIYAPPNSGKNFFFDAVAAFFINYGTIGTANKTNNFAFAEAANKRLILWNEPNYENCHIEKLKEILGGDTTKVHVKYQSDQALQGPPVIILTNDSLNIFGMSAFKTRIKLYRWRNADFLKDFDRKINPLFLIPLLNKYNIN